MFSCKSVGFSNNRRKVTRELLQLVSWVQVSIIDGICIVLLGVLRGFNLFLGPLDQLHCPVIE